MGKKLNKMKTGTELIAEERQRQIEKEGWTKEHDAKHIKEELSFAAACYALPNRCRYTIAKSAGFTSTVPDFWSFKFEWWKPTPDDRVRELVKAGALIAAEIDRLLNK